MGGIATVVQEYIHAGLFQQAPVYYVVTHCDGSAPRKLVRAVAGYVQLLLLLFRRKVVLLHIHLSSRASFWRKLPICVLARLLRYPYMLHLHASEFMAFYEHESGWIAKRLIRHVFDHADIVLALSPEWQQNVATFTSNADIRILPNGVRVAEFLSLRNRNRSTVQLLFLGRLGKRKGIYDLLLALARIRAVFPEFVLVAAGDGETEDVEKEASRLALAGNVIVPGWIDADRRLELLEQSDIFVLPSHAEGLPMSLLEAMAAGLPVVCSTVGGIPLAVSDGQEGLLVEPGDVDGLGQALARMMQDAAFRAACGQRAFERAKREFSVQTCVHRLLDIYQSYGVAIQR